MGKSSYDKVSMVKTTKVTIKDKAGTPVSIDKLLIVDSGSAATYIDFENLKSGKFDEVKGVAVNRIGGSVVLGGGTIDVETEPKGGATKPADVKTKTCKMQFCAVKERTEYWKGTVEKHGAHGILGNDQKDYIRVNFIVTDRDKEVPTARFERDKED